jgi:hypothetical protein
LVKLVGIGQPKVGVEPMRGKRVFPEIFLGVFPAAFFDFNALSMD